MAAKRQIKINRKPKAEEEAKNTVPTVEENENNNVEPSEPETPSVVEENVMGMIGTTTVTKPRGRIKFEAQRASVPLFMVPEDIRQYLINHGLGTNVWQKDKEWLKKHNVDMKMVEKLKKFLSGNL